MLFTKSVRRTAVVLLSPLILALPAFTRPSAAQLALTPAGSSAGFGLSTVATGFPHNGSIGPIGIAVLGSGQVMTSDALGNVRLFPTDTDGQNAASISPAQNFGTDNAYGLAIVNGVVYMGGGSSRRVVRLNADGTYNSTLASVPGVALVVNPTNGHLFTSTGFLGSSVYDIDPTTGSVSTFLSGPIPDGLVFNASGSVLYLADRSTNHVLGYDTTTKSQVFDSGYISDVPDGIAIGSGSIAGNMFINTNGGNVYEINLTSKVQTLIASGGSRGDFVTPDPNGTLLLTQTDRILRLTAPPPNGRFNMAQTTLTLTSSNNPSQSGTSVTFTAHVVAQGTTAIPTGTVTFSTGPNASQPVTVQLDATGTATYTTTFYVPGGPGGASAVNEIQINAQYSGDSADFSSSASITQQVVRQGSEGGPLR